MIYSGMACTVADRSSLQIGILLNDEPPPPLTVMAGFLMRGRIGGMKREHLITATLLIVGAAMAAIGIYYPGERPPIKNLVLAVCVGVGSVMVGTAWARMPPFNRWNRYKK